jgi:hypothetical protein
MRPVTCRVQQRFIEILGRSASIGENNPTFIEIMRFNSRDILIE